MSEYNERMEAIVKAWKPYLEGIDDWQEVVKAIEPKPSGCGLVYELPNPSELDRPNESFAIADMRDLDVAEPHYHANGETEIYFVLQGLGLVVVGRKEQLVDEGSVVITPPDTVHFTVPQGDLVLAVVNTPPFNSDNYVTVTETDERVGFDQEQFVRLSQ